MASIRYDRSNGEILKACRKEWDEGARFVVATNQGDLFFQGDKNINKYFREHFPILITPLDMFENDIAGNNLLRGRFA